MLHSQVTELLLWMLPHSTISVEVSFSMTLIGIQNHKERGCDKVSYGLAAVQVEVNYVLCSYNRQV